MTIGVLRIMCRTTGFEKSVTLLTKLDKKGRIGKLGFKVLDRKSTRLNSSHGS